VIHVTATEAARERHCHRAGNVSSSCKEKPS
jgi:hypothetical protein